MKITTNQLRRIIKEEVANVMFEATYDGDTPVTEFLTMLMGMGEQAAKAYDKITPENKKTFMLDDKDLQYFGDGTLNLLKTFRQFKKQ